MNDTYSKPKRPHKNSGFDSSRIGVKSSKPQSKPLLMTFIPKETPSLSSQMTKAETYEEEEEEKSSDSSKSSTSSRKSSDSSSSPTNNSEPKGNDIEKTNTAPLSSKNQPSEVNLLEENYDEIINVILHSKKKTSANDIISSNITNSMNENELLTTKSSFNSTSNQRKMTKFQGRAYLRQQSISPMEIINQHDDEVKGMTNTQEISNFYDYTKSCMKMILTIATLEHHNPTKVSFPFVKDKESNVDKKLAVFDLDETLVHCLTKDIENADNIVEVPLPSKKTARIGVLVRPHWKEAIRRIQKKYHIVIYTASHQSYADAVLNFLDPENKYFPFRLYRNNCIMVKNDTQIIYVKDCSIFNDFDLKDVVLVDNSVLSFAYHLENGIPILPYYDAKVDFELLFCACYLESICEYEDLRVGNKKMLKLDQFLCQAIEELEEEKKEKRHKRKEKTANNEEDQPQQEKKRKKHKEKTKGKSNKDIMRKKASNFCLDFKYDLQELRNKFNNNENNKD